MYSEALNRVEMERRLRDKSIDIDKLLAQRPLKEKMLSNRWVMACMGFFICEVIASALLVVFYLTIGWGFTFDFEAHSGLINIPVVLMLAVGDAVLLLGTITFAMFGLFFFAEIPEAEDYKKSLALSLLSKQHSSIREGGEDNGL